MIVLQSQVCVINMHFEIEPPCQKSFRAVIISWLAKVRSKYVKTVFSQPKYQIYVYQISDAQCLKD